MSPSPWATKPIRSILWGSTQQQQDYSNIMNEMLCILPFEPSYFSSKSAFIGHPCLETNHFRGTTPMPLNQFHIRQPQWAARIHPRVQVRPSVRKITFFPGSRHQEIKVAMKIMAELIPSIQREFEISISVIESTKQYLQEFLAAHNFIATLVSSKEELFTKTDLAIAISGTIVTELGANSIPTIVFYDAGLLTRYIAKKIALVKHVSIPNILADETIIPEHLFSQCNAHSILKSVKTLTCSQLARQYQVDRVQAILPKLVNWDESKQSPVPPTALITQKCLDYIMVDHNKSKFKTTQTRVVE